MIRPASDQCFHHTERRGVGLDYAGSASPAFTHSVVVETRLDLRVSVTVTDEAWTLTRVPDLARQQNIEALLLALRREVGAKAWGEIDDAVAMQDGNRNAAWEEAAREIGRLVPAVGYVAALYAARAAHDQYRETLANRERAR